MSITSGFFDSADGDRKYTSEQLTSYFEGLVSDGIYENVGDAFVVKAAGEGLNITVGSGRALCKGHWIKNDSPITLSLSPASSQYPRVDSVFIRYNANTRTVDVVVSEGVPAPYPQTPQPTRTEIINDLFIAGIRVEKNAAVLTQSGIYDMRASASCGWVTGLITQVDTSRLFLQWQSAYEEQFALWQSEYKKQSEEFENYLTQKQSEFNTFFEHLTKKLTVDTTIRRYQSVISIDGTTTALNVGIPEYDSKTDVLSVYVDGVFLAERLPVEDDMYTVGDYIVSGTGETARITFDKALTGAHTAAFVVLKSIIGEGSTGNIPVNAYILASSAGEGILGNVMIPYTCWNYWQGTEDVQSASTVNASPTAECMLLAVVMHRDSVTIEGEGWTKVVESVTAISGETNQCITIWAKTVEKGRYGVTVDQASNVRMGLKLIALYKAKSVSVVDNTLISEFPYKPTTASGKRRLYLLSSIFASGSNIAIQANDTGELDLRKAEATRFSVFYDYQPEKNITPEFSVTVSDYNKNTANAVTLDIIEED